MTRLTRQQLEKWAINPLWLDPTLAACAMNMFGPGSDKIATRRSENPDPFMGENSLP